MPDRQSPAPGSRFGPLSDALTVLVDGRAIAAQPGETLAAALYAAGIRAWHRSRSGEARGLLCGMGICYDCLVEVDGALDVRACQLIVQDGMRVTTGLVTGRADDPDAQR